VRRPRTGASRRSSRPRRHAPGRGCSAGSRAASWGSAPTEPAACRIPTSRPARAAVPAVHPGRRAAARPRGRPRRPRFRFFCVWRWRRSPPGRSTRSGRRAAVRLVRRRLAGHPPLGGEHVLHPRRRRCRTPTAPGTRPSRGSPPSARSSWARRARRCGRRWRAGAPRTRSRTSGCAPTCAGTSAPTCCRTASSRSCRRSSRPRSSSATSSRTASSRRCRCSGR
jgi:hypothetical protein